MLVCNTLQVINETLKLYKQTVLNKYVWYKCICMYVCICVCIYICMYENMKSDAINGKYR